MATSTLNELLERTLAIPRPAIMKFRKDGKWHDITVEEFRRTVRGLSCALRHLGVKREDRVAILSENRPEWTQSDFAILAAGAVTVPIYPTLLGWQIEYILNDSGSVAVICSDVDQLKKIEEIRGHCPTVRHVILCDAPDSMPAGVRSFRSVVEMGADLDGKKPDEFDQIARSRKPDDLATIVYTSGTTGNPKGAMLSHGNISSNVAATCSVLKLRNGETALSILPLSHILERMGDFAFLHEGGCVAYNDDLTRVADNLQEVRPDVFAAVPRLFEKMRAKILDNVASAPPIRQKLFHWAVGVGAERLPYIIERRPLPPLLAVKSKIAHELVFSKIHQRLGGRVRMVLSGGAPLSQELAAFFIGAGVEILEGYGLTETSPVITVNTMEHRKLGTVGKTIPGVEVRIAGDGEILTRGPHVMKGYFNNPEATAQAIDSDGWFHTGDIGEIDGEGYLRITDRKKDIIVNAYGKNIAPQPLENMLKSSPLIGTAVLIGDRRKYLSALIVPNFERLQHEAAELGIETSNTESLLQNPRVVKLFDEEIEKFNERLDRQEQVRRFTLLQNDFTIESGEITPSMKVKRRVVEENYREMIDAMYQDEKSVERTV